MNKINSLLESYINMFKVNGKLGLLNLQPGQVVRGQVLELIGNNNALVSINNNKLIARLEIPLAKGQNSFFVVTSVGDEIKLKILTDYASRNKLVNDLPGLMNKLDIKNTSINKTILNEIVKMEIPLEKKLVQIISDIAKGNKDIKNIMQAVKLLNTKNLPVTSTNIRSINELFQNNDLISKLSNINNDIHKILIDTSKENSARTTIDQGATIINNKTMPDINNVKLPKEALETANYSFKTEVSEKMTFQLKRVSSQIEQILNDFKNYNEKKNIDSKTLEFNKELSNVNISKVDSKQILTNLTKFINLLQQQYSISSTVISNNNLFNNLGDLLAGKVDLPNDLVTNIEKTINHIIGQNLTLVPEQSVFSQTIIQFPGLSPFSEKPVFIQVQTKKKEDSKNLDPEDMMLVFLFNLDNLGDVMVQMKILHKQLFLQINNDNPNIKKIINTLEPEFINFVEKNGYKTTGLSVSSIQKKQDINNSSYQSTYKGVDIKI